MANTIKAVFAATMARDSVVSMPANCAWYLGKTSVNRGKDVCRSPGCRETIGVKKLRDRALAVIGVEEQSLDQHRGVVVFEIHKRMVD